MPREKTVYQEKYYKHKAKINNDVLPQMPHVPDTHDVKEAYIDEAGIVERNGEQMEYQVIRVYMKEKDNG